MVQIVDIHPRGTQGSFYPKQSMPCHSIESHSKDLGPVSIFDKTSYCKITQSLEAVRLVFRIIRSLWNLTGASAAVLPRCLSNFKAIRSLRLPISQFRDFTRSYEFSRYILSWAPEGWRRWWRDLLQYTIYSTILLVHNQFLDWSFWNFMESYSGSYALKSKCHFN